MQTKDLVNHILDDDALTRGLGDAEARALVEWLVDQAESRAEDAGGPAAAEAAVHVLCRRGRAIGRFVGLWSQPSLRGAAFQLAAAERLDWPLPEPEDDPCELMHAILHWESERLAA